MDRAAMASPGALHFESVSWRQAQGPVWQGHGWGGTILFGFQMQARGSWSFVTMCSACEGDRCWHVAALGKRVLETAGESLVQWQREADRMRGPGASDWRGRPTLVPREPSPEEKFRAWIGVREGSAASTNRDAPYMGRHGGGSSEELIFMLSGAEGGNARLQLEAGFSRLLKSKSAMTKFIDSNDSYTERPMPHCMRLPVYADYARWCASNFVGMKGQTKWSSMVLDERGVAMVKAAAESGLLYVYDAATDRPVGPAKWGGVRCLGWKWTPKDGELWEVRHEIEGGGDAYFGDVPMFVDVKGLEVGMLDLQGMDPSNAEMVQSAPPIPAKWIEENAQSTSALRFLPRPPEEVVQRSNRIIQGVQPIPVLTVEVKDKKEVFGFDLAFKYDDVLDYFAEQQDAIQFIKRDGETIELVRDMASEARARAAMKAVGIVRSGAGEWRFEGDRAAQVEGFRRLLACDFAPLRDAGFEIAQVSGWSSRVQEVDSVGGGFDAGDGLEGFDGETRTAGLEFSMGFVIEGERYNLLPLVSQIVEVVGGVEGIARMAVELAEGESSEKEHTKLWVVDEGGRWIGLPRVELMPWLTLMAELLAGRKVKDLAAPSIVLTRIEALRMEAEAPELQLGGSGATIVQELLAAKRCTDEIQIEGFTATLEPFQRTGVHWMRVLGKHGLGGLLGDDRGLGKTVQCIAHLQDVKQRGGLTHPALVVAIPTQVRHWEKHLHRLAPGLKVLVLAGGDRRSMAERLKDYDVIVTNWEKVPKDIEWLSKQRFSASIWDETEKIHNHQTNVAKAVRLLNVGYAIALNGSPLENTYGDVWSVLDAVLHGYLGSEALFKRSFRIPIEENQSVEKLRQLRKRLAPFMLRRLKKDSGVSLPPVQHEDVALRIKGAQANLYEAIRITTEEKVKEAMAGGMEGTKKGRILAILTRLRQVCCDPRLTDMGRDRKIKESAKMDWIERTVPAMVKEGRRVLLVCYFSEMFDLIGPVLDRHGVPYSMIRQGVNNREAQKEAFKEGRTKVFLLGLKSGGRGTDLPEADTVVHVDPWWNPKAHDQATDRAHRMGQQNKVLNLRLFIEGSFEERVMEIQERKRLFADSLDDETVLDESKITEEDVREMLRPLQETADDDEDMAA
jgi:hypothetical protein